MSRTAAASSTHGYCIYRLLTSHTLNATCLLLAITTGLVKGQSSAEVRQAFRDLHDDKIPGNCVRATNWLLQHREEMKEDLLDELYKTDTDSQERDAILYVLFNTSSFAPDERFARLVIARLPEQDSQVRNGAIFELKGNALEPIYTSGAHWEAWPFMNKHFSTFESLLKEQIGRTNNVFVLWGTAWLFKKRGLLRANSTLFTPAILDSVAVNLRADNQRYNASHAVRLFLLLGDQSLPTLQKAASSGDRQSRYLATAAIDALTKGSHNAFGYLCANLNLTGVPFGDKPAEPSWLPEAMKKYDVYQAESDETTTKPVDPYP